MQKSLISSIAIAFTLGIPLAALADSYDNFISKQVAEFENPNGEKCKEKSMKGDTESGREVTYELCIYKGKPVRLRTSYDGAPMSASIFKGGKVVQIMWEAGGVGFRNGQPVVEWNGGESGKRGVNWSLNAEQKSDFIKMAAKEKRVLRKFGL
jgi:hypothetical protein